MRQDLGGIRLLTPVLHVLLQVVISDFPDPALVNNIAKNIDLNISSLDSDEVASAVAKVSLVAKTVVVGRLDR